MRLAPPLPAAGAIVRLRQRSYLVTEVQPGTAFTSGLVALAGLDNDAAGERHIVRHLRTALKMNRLFSNDPVCAQHQPDQEWHREGAAYHGCLLIAERSCERGNGDRDRAFVVPTVERGT